MGKVGRNTKGAVALHHEMYQRRCQEVERAHGQDPKRFKNVNRRISELVQSGKLGITKKKFFEILERAAQPINKPESDSEKAQT